MPAHDPKEILGAKVIPDAVGCKDKDITMTNLVIRYIGIAGIVAQWRSTKYSGSRQYLGGNYRELIWGIEGMRLRVGIVMDGVETEVYKTRISKALMAISTAIRIVHDTYFAT